jgi:hypothetical protein
MNSCRTFVLSIVALFAVVSLSAHGEQMAAAANNQGAGAVVDANGNLKVPPDYRTSYQFLGSWAIASDKGKGSIFTVEGAELYKRDLKDIEFHLLDTGHFALEEDLDQICALMCDFLDRKVPKNISIT